MRCTEVVSGVFVALRCGANGWYSTIGIAAFGEVRTSRTLIDAKMCGAALDLNNEFGK